MIASSSSSSSSTTLKEDEMRSELSSLLSSINVISSKIKQFDDKCLFDDIETEKVIKEIKNEINIIYNKKNIKTNDAYDNDITLAENARTNANQSIIDMMINKEEIKLKEQAIIFEEELIESMKEDLINKERDFQAEFKTKMKRLLDEEDKEQEDRLNKALHTHKTELSILKEMV